MKRKKYLRKELRGYHQLRVSCENHDLECMIMNRAILGVKKHPLRPDQMVSSPLAG